MTHFALATHTDVWSYEQLALPVLVDLGLLSFALNCATANIMVGSADLLEVKARNLTYVSFDVYLAIFQ